jgi:hypothetical protein
VKSPETDQLCLIFHRFIHQVLKIGYDRMRTRYEYANSRLEFFYENATQIVTFEFEYMKDGGFDDKKTRSYSFDYWEQKLNELGNES